MLEKQEKCGLTLYYDYIDIFKKLNDKQLKDLIFAMFDYDLNKTIHKLDPVTDMAFTLIKQQIDEDNEY